MRDAGGTGVSPEFLWLRLKRVGIILKMRFGGASEAEREAFRRRWDKKCWYCDVPKWNHAGQNHDFKGKVEP